MDLKNAIIPLALGYLLGSIPFGLILTRLTGAGDLRAIGSGNIGATNVLRTGRKGLAAATLLLDAGKGALAVVIIRTFFWPNDAGLWAYAGLAALVGHCFPVWLRFKGGKGVATMLGVALALDWRIGVMVAVVWLLVVLATRMSSLGGMAMAVAAPLAAYALAGTFFVFKDHAPALAIMAVIVIWQHRANISRIIAGTEPRLGQKG